METERQQQFNERLSQWLSSQGFWFQLRHSLGGGGVGGNITFHVLRLTFRVMVFLLIAAVVAGIYLVKRTDRVAFREEFQESLLSSLGASELAIRGVKRSQGALGVNRLAGTGLPQTFFEFFEARNVRADMGLLDGMVGIWDPGNVRIHRLEAQLRAGANSPEDAAAMADVIFQRSGKVDFRALTVVEATLRWGYSERTRGSIVGSAMQANRVEEGWRVTFRGGKFTQNWLRDLDIMELIALCTPEGILFEKAQFRRGSGTVDFSGLRVHGGDRPAVDGTLKLRGIALEHILPPPARNFIEGRITSDFTVGGSTNTLDGVTYDGLVSLDGFDVVTLRDRIPLLRALSVVDLFNNYRKVDFSEGSFQMRTGGGALQISRADVRAEDLLTLAGAFVIRPPNEDEREAMLARTAGGRGLSPVFIAENDEDLTLDADELERRFTLRRAADAARRERDGEVNDSDNELFDRLGLNFETRMLEEQQSERLARMLIYEGEVVVTLRPDAFERAETLRRQHPVDQSTGRIPLRVPLNGGLFELTLRQAETIYEQGRR